MNKKSIGVMALVLSTAIFLTACGKDKNKVEEVEDFTPVEISEINKETLKNPRSFKGKVISNEEIMIMPKLMGTVQNINVKLGDKVNQGQVLFSIDASDLQRNLEQSNLAVELAQKGVRQAETVLNTARINRNTTEQNMRQAKLDYERAESLFNEGAIPKVQLEQSNLAYLSADSQLKTVDSQIVQSEISLEQSRDQLSQSEVSRNQVLSTMKDANVTTPLSGVVSSLDVKVGQLVSNAGPAATIVDNSKVFIEINVSESIVNKLSKNQQVGVKIPAAFDGEVSSTIDYISPTADVGNKLYTLKVYTDNSSNKIKPGMTGEVNLNTDEVKDVIAVPRDVILKENGKSYVYIVDNNKAIRKDVVLGEDFDDYIVINSGLKLGDKIVIKGHHYLNDQKPVKIMEAK